MVLEEEAKLIDDSSVNSTPVPKKLKLKDTGFCSLEMSVDNIKQEPLDDSECKNGHLAPDTCAPSAQTRQPQSTYLIRCSGEILLQTCCKHGQLT